MHKTMCDIVVLSKETLLHPTLLWLLSANHIILTEGYRYLLESISTKLELVQTTWVIENKCGWQEAEWSEK